MHVVRARICAFIFHVCMCVVRSIFFFQCFKLLFSGDSATSSSGRRVTSHFLFFHRPNDGRVRWFGFSCRLFLTQIQFLQARVSKSIWVTRDTRPFDKICFFCSVCLSVCVVIVALGVHSLEQKNMMKNISIITQHHPLWWFVLNCP